MRNMNDLLRQAQVMQNKISRLQQEMAEKGGDETRETYRIRLPRNLDGIVVNIPAYLAGLPEEVWMTEFVTLTPQEEPEEEVPAGDEFGMEDIGDF